MSALARASWCALALCAAPAYALEACDPDETLTNCWQRSYQIAKALDASNAVEHGPQRQLAEHTAETADLLQKRLLLEPVGVATGLAQSATQNLLPNFNLTGTGIGKGTDISAVVGNINFALPTAEANGGQLRVTAIPKPDVAAPVREALTAAGAQVGDLEDKLGPKDDLTVETTFALRGFGFGRDLSLYRDELSGLLSGAFSDRLGSANQHQFEAKLSTCVGLGVNLWQLTPATLREQAEFKANADECSKLLDKLPAYARAHWGTQVAFANARERAHLERFADLVSNQPQLTLTIGHTWRDPLVGASLTSARLSFEMGWVNLNSFKRAAGATCLRTLKPATDDAPHSFEGDEACLDAFRHYVERGDADRHPEDPIRPDIRSQDRIAAWIEYARLQDLHFTLPEHNVDLRIDGASRLAASAGASRTLLTEGEGLSTRVDAFVRYQHFVSDPVRLDHTVYSVVLTQRIGTLNLPLVLAYSDRSEFRGGSKGLLATVGLASDFGLPPAPEVPSVSLSKRIGVTPF